MSAKNLVIVESPAKAKTIEGFLGPDFVVKSSYGHIRDLPKKSLNVAIEDNFTPHYEISTEKKKVVAELKKAAKGKTVWLASDEDREGEAIAWHLCHALGLDPQKTNRIVFHEITKQAIDTAIKSPRRVHQSLVDAQQARRILDRIVGYELSPVLWKKIRRGLSAGRVQSVAVRLIVEREREIANFNPENSFKISAEFSAEDNSTPFEAGLAKPLPNQASARSFLEEHAIESFYVSSIETKPSKRQPPAPFTTSTLQQEAARRLGYGVKQTMMLAQRLYESGHITYMRTDSMTLSTQATNAIKQYVTTHFGNNYHSARSYKTKQQNAQEAHEAIRPTRIETSEVATGDQQQQKLYKLIWQRTVASQMATAIIDVTTLTIKPKSHDKSAFITKGQILVFDGYMKVYGGTKDDIILPKLSLQQPVKCLKMIATEVFSKPPARYSEASLVRTLEEKGIGRPSTYAPTISTIQARGYIEKVDLEGKSRSQLTLSVIPPSTKITDETQSQTYGADKNKLLPTPIADVTTDFLAKNFESIVDYDFTAKAESQFDTIAAGKETWTKVLSDFYQAFHPLIEQSDQISRQESTQTRHIGDDPKTGKPIFARYGKYGPMLQLGETEAEEKPAFAPLPEGSGITTVTLDQALTMFSLPRKVGTTTDGKEIIANIGRFGPYIKIDSKFVSIKPLDPFQITQEEARDVYQKKLKQEEDKYIQTFKDGVQVINGPYGPYITNGKKNARLPKAIDPKKITHAEALSLLDKAPEKKKRTIRRKTKK
jgi:DNA topoisomerase I